MLPALFSANDSASYFMEKREPIKRLAQPLTTAVPYLIALYPCTLLFSLSFLFFFFGCTTQHMETLVPWSEVEPKPPALEAGSLNHQGSPMCYFSWSNTCQKHQPANIQSARNVGLLLFPPSILYPVLVHFKSMQNSLVVTWIFLINKRPLWNFNQVQTAPKETDHWYSAEDCWFKKKKKRFWK